MKEITNFKLKLYQRANIPKRFISLQVYRLVLNKTESSRMTHQLTLTLLVSLVLVVADQYDTMIETSFPFLKCTIRYWSCDAVLQNVNDDLMLRYYLNHM